MDRQADLSKAINPNNSYKKQTPIGFKKHLLDSQVIGKPDHETVSTNIYY